MLLIECRIKCLEEHIELQSSEFIKHKESLTEYEINLLIDNQNNLCSELKLLRGKVQKLENVELKQMRSERKCKELERKILHDEEEKRIISVSRQQLLSYQEVCQSNKQLLEENSILR